MNRIIEAIEKTKLSPIIKESTLDYIYKINESQKGMVETNESYMSQDQLDGILSSGFSYTPPQKELDTKVLYDDYYVSLICHVAYCLSVAACESSCDRKYGNYLTAGDKMSQIARVRELITEIEELKGRKVVRNPKLRDLNLGDFNNDIAHIQKLIKEIKHYGCPDYMKTYFSKFVEIYKNIPKPILISN